jgi:hypothetical protein
LISDPNKNSQFLGDSKNGGVINMAGNTRVTVFHCTFKRFFLSLVYSQLFM